MRKKAFAIPFFTPIIALILATLIGIAGLIYGAMIDKYETEVEQQEQVEIVQNENHN